MTQQFFAKKQTMTEGYLGDTRVAVTKLALYETSVVREKTVEKDGYVATLLSFGKTRKSGKKQYRREVTSLSESIDPGTVVHVSATSKGKGTAGVVKRWGFAGGPRTHGQSDRLRAPGSIGQGTTPGRVLKGRHMAGRMGNATVTVRNLTVVAVDQVGKSIWVAGPVPGVTGALVKLTVTDQKKNLAELKFLKGYNPSKQEEVAVNTEEVQG